MTGISSDKLSSIECSTLISGSFTSYVYPYISAPHLKFFPKNTFGLVPVLSLPLQKAQRFLITDQSTKLVFSALITLITTFTTTASQTATKAKNSKKQQQTVTTAIVTPNPFVVPDEIFNKIFTAAASLLPDMDGNSSSMSSKLGQDQPLAVLPNVVLFGKSLPIPVAKQPINPDDFKN
ncbi:hypothetical protein G9A89_009478 [Geosiphon pyriformis]|nr:hypothetical protein G9A89_009478 [Geosiphon pyriformis]